MVVLETDGPLDCLSQCANVFEVDGKPRGAGSFVKYQLTPGYHEIGLQFMEPNAKLFFSVVSDRIYLGFTGEAGHTYRIETSPDIKQMIVHVRIVDLQSGLDVSRVFRTEKT